MLRIYSGALHHDQCVLPQLRDDWSNHSSLQQPSFSVCEPLATSLLSVLTPAVDLVGFCITCGWPYTRDPCRRLLLPVRVLHRVRNLHLHVQLLCIPCHSSKTDTWLHIIWWHSPKYTTPQVLWKEHWDRIRSLESIHQSIHPSFDILVPTESLAASHTTVSKWIPLCSPRITLKIKKKNDI